MKVTEIVELIKNENPKALGNIPEKRAAAIIREALARLAQQLATAEEGTVKVQGLGNFRIVNVEREKEGQKIAGKRIVFAAAKPAVKPEGAAAE